MKRCKTLSSAPMTKVEARKKREMRNVVEDEEAADPEGLEIERKTRKKRAEATRSALMIMNSARIAMSTKKIAPHAMSGTNAPMPAAKIRKTTRKRKTKRIRESAGAGEGKKMRMKRPVDIEPEPKEHGGKGQ